MPIRRDASRGGWVGQESLLLPDGTKRRVTARGKTRSQCQGALTRARDKILNPEKHAKKSEVPTFSAYADEFLASHKPSSKESQKRSKKQIVNSSLVPFFGPMTLDAIKQSDVDRFCTTELQKNSIKTCNNKLAVLSSVLKYAWKNGLIDRPSLSMKLAGMAAEIHAVPMSDVDKLVSHAKDLRIRAAVLLAAEAGLRAGEIRGLQWGDIGDGQLRVRRALDKETGQVQAPKHNKRRTVPLSPRLTAELGAMPRLGLWIVSRLDGGPLSYYGLAEQVGNLYKTAEVVRPPKIIHCLRHTFGTTCAARGVPIPVLQKLMGHAQISTTMQYIDVSEDQKRSAIADAFGPPCIRNASGTPET